MVWAKVVVVMAVLLVGASAASPSDRAKLAVSVVFQTDWVPRYRTADVYVIPARGGTRRALTRNEVDDVHPAWAPDGRTIVFGRQGDLLALSRRGGTVRRLTRTAMREVDAAWSPDGRRLAFEGGRFGREQIYVMNADGSNRRQITNDRGCARDPTWADSERIVFLACTTGPTSLMSIRYDGTDLRPIASNSPHEDFDYQPAVSPDGKRLVFTRSVSDRNRKELWIAEADGSHARRFIRDAAQAVWSPDGKRIAFVHGPHLVGDEEQGFGFVGGAKISVIAADGTGLKHLTPQPEYIYGGVSPFPGWRWTQGGIRILGLSWSPDGRSIAYSHRFERRQPDIAAIGRHSALRRLTTNRRIDTQPALSPDGRQVAFISLPRAGGFGSLFVTGIKASGVRRLATRAWTPAWSPDGRWLVYDAGDGISVIQASGSFNRRVAAESANRFVHTPVWSADGRRVLYLGTHRGGRRTAIWSVRRNGTDAIRIGSLPSSVGRVDWSPDRTHAVFSRTRRLFVMNADGSGVRALGPRHRREVAAPAWCRDAQTVVYAARQDGDWDLYAMTTDGRVMAKLTDNLADDYVPDC